MFNIHLLIALINTLLFNGVIGVTGFASAILFFSPLLLFNNFKYV